MNQKIDAFEKINGNLQGMYNAWRTEADRTRREGGTWCFTDSGFAEARRKFSKYCGLKEIIPFDVMFWYESNFEKL